MLLNLWSELIMLTTKEDTIVFPFENIEEKLTKHLVDYYHHHNPKVLYVINGPGSFTNLRVWTLVANLMYELSEHKLQMKTIGKLELFRYLYLHNILPEEGYIYFWQRKKFWLRSGETNAKELVLKSDFDKSQRDDKMFVDWFVGQDFSVFSKNAKDIELMIDEDLNVLVSREEKTLSCTDIFEPTTKIVPLYGVELSYTKNN